MSDSDCDCCNPDDPCASQNCTFFEDNFNATIGSRISSYPNAGTPPSTITASASQSSSRGNDPPCWRVDTDINSTAGQYGDLFAINMTTWSWNPSSQGAITSLRFCIDEYIDNDSYYTRSDSTSKGPSVECWFIVKQGGKTYGCKISSLNTKAVWRKQYLDGIVQDDFEEIYSGERPAEASVTNTSSHPNFTFLGGAITFGWAVRPEGPDSRLDIQTEAYTFWDNLCIHLTHDARTVDPGSLCQPAGCTLFASSLSDFTADVVNYSGQAGTTTASVSQATTEGRSPPCVKISGTAPGTGAPVPDPASSVCLLFHKDAVAPSSICGIYQVSICFDFKRSPGDGSIPVYFACRQGGRLYVSSAGEATESWQSVNAVLSENVFVEVSGASWTNKNLSSHPDYSSSGGNIEFGVAYQVKAFTGNTTGFIDNLCVKITPAPECLRSYMIDIPSVWLEKVASPTGAAWCDQALLDGINSLIASPIIMAGHNVPTLDCASYSYLSASPAGSASFSATLHRSQFDIFSPYRWIITYRAALAGQHLTMDLALATNTPLPLCGQSVAIEALSQESAAKPCFQWAWTPGAAGTLEAI